MVIDEHFVAGPAGPAFQGIGGSRSERAAASERTPREKNEGFGGSRSERAAASERSPREKNEGFGGSASERGPRETKNERGC
jgi:hypothetical protein